MNVYDYIVVGAGMAGASVAYELANAGGVVLLEREAAPGYHSTGRSAALFTEAYGNATVRALTVASRAFFEGPPERFAAHALLRERGVLFVASETQLPRLQALYAEVSRLPVRLSMEDGGFARRVIPVLRAEAAVACIWEPDARDIDVDAVLQGYLRGLRARGGVVTTHSPVTALARDGEIWCATTPSGEYRGRIVVNAAGAWAGEVAHLAGARGVPLTPKRRTACLVDVPAGHDARHWPMVVDADEQCYFKPDAGRLMVSPADATPTVAADAQPDDFDVAIAIDRFEKLTTIEVTKVHRPWAGLRTFAPDASPVCGLDPEVPGFFWLAGQGGYGIQMAPALARVAARLAGGGDLPADLVGLGVSAAALAPARFGNGMAQV